MRKGWGAIAVGAVVLAVAGFAQSGAGRAALRDAGVAGTGPAYTALSFASPRYLPTQLYSRVALLPASFVIRNDSAQERRYPWQVEEIRNGRARQIASGQATVGAGAAETISRSFVASCASGRLKIEVRLPGADESIAFWAACWSGTARRKPAERKPAR